MAFKVTPEWMMQAEFDAPIPGEILTTRLGSNPMERPPMYPDPKVALQVLFKSMQEEVPLRKLMNMLAAGVPLDIVASSVLENFVGEGGTTPQAAMTMAPAFTAGMMRMAAAAEIDIVLSTDDDPEEEGPDPEELALFTQIDRPKEENKAANAIEKSAEELSDLPKSEKGIGFMQNIEGLV